MVYVLKTRFSGLKSLFMCAFKEEIQPLTAGVSLG